jgi:hypothetical protein
VLLFRAGGPGQIVQGFEVDPGEGDGHQLQISTPVALLKAVQIVEHAPFQGAGAFGFFRGEPLQRQGCQVRVVVDDSHGPTLRT